MRLNKACSILGICSRREADRYILQKLVQVNGKVITNIGTKVQVGDEILFNNCKYTVSNNIALKVWIYNKPRGVITTHNDPQGRRTVFQIAEQTLKQRVISIGRLDINSEGLLLLTNSGEFKQYAERSKWKRVYKVRVFGNLTSEMIAMFWNGLKIGQYQYAPMKVQIISCTGMNSWCLCTLTEGRNREIRKLFDYFNLQVNRLIRIKYGPFDLSSLKLGEIKEVQLPEKFTR